jgi:hypothetical protein
LTEDSPLLDEIIIHSKPPLLLRYKYKKQRWRSPMFMNSSEKERQLYEKRIEYLRILDALLLSNLPDGIYLEEWQFNAKFVSLLKDYRIVSTPQDIERELRKIYRGKHYNMGSLFPTRKKKGVKKQ